jgi:plastocyanin
MRAVPTQDLARSRETWRGRNGIASSAVSTRVYMVVIVLAAGCADPESGGADAAVDGPVDATPADAEPSTVIVAPNCTGIDVATIDVDLGTTEDAFTLTTIELEPGGVVRFFTSDGHNFVSVASTRPRFQFRSGLAGGHLACLTFTAPTEGPIAYTCDPHPEMTGTLTVVGP